MLNLPTDWQRGWAGKIASVLLRQIELPADRVVFASALISAALRLWASTSRGPQLLLVKRNGPLRWSVNGLRYFYIPEMNDPAFYAFLDMRRYLHRDFFIVPSDSDGLFRQAASSALGDRCPIIQSLESFLAWREFCASMDASRKPADISFDLFANYNQGIAEMNREDLAIVKRVSTKWPTPSPNPSVPALWPQ